MPTRKVVLTDRQSDLVDRLVDSGNYQNGSEVLREGLRLIAQREAGTGAHLKALRNAARIGIADIDAGRYRRFDSAKELELHLTGLAETAMVATRTKTVR